MASLISLIKKHGGLIQTGPFGSQLKQSEYSDDGVPVVMPKDIYDGKIDSTLVARVSENKAQTLSRHYLKAGTILFPRRGDIAKCALITEREEGYLCGTGCIKIEPPKGHIDPTFLYYFLTQSKITEWLEKNAIGSTMLNLNTQIIGRIDIPDISFNAQLEISNVLKNYDDLIENNRRRIQLLEESARLLYKEWFVHLRFPGHEHVKIVDGVPEGWMEKSLGEIIVLNYGKALKADERVPGPYPVYGSSGVIGFHDKALVKGPAIILGRKGNVGSVFWSAKDFFPIDTVYFVENSASNLYLYFALQRMKFINTDVAVPGLNRAMAYSRKLLIPKPSLLEAFLRDVEPLQQQIEKLAKYNNKLAEARDLLLPRLMNGELTL